MMYNLPNILAMTRILLAPLLLLILLNRDFFTDLNIHISWVHFFATIVFIIASITDFFDGFVARRLNQITNLGKILDPLADKMLMTSAFLALIITGMASAWAIYIMLVRELFITGLRIAMAKDGLDVSASALGKIKTIIQMIAVGFLMMDWIFADELLWISVFFSLYSSIDYVKVFYKHNKKHSKQDGKGL